MKISSDKIHLETVSIPEVFKTKYFHRSRTDQYGELPTVVLRSETRQTPKQRRADILLEIEASELDKLKWGKANALLRIAEKFGVSYDTVKIIYYKSLNKKP